MRKFVIERNVPGAGKLSHAELQDLSKKSCAVLGELGPTITWDHSYVTDDKLYCIYNAANADLVRKHAELGGFPADSIRRISAIIDPTTAED